MVARILLLAWVLFAGVAPAQVRTGSDLLLRDSLHLVRGKRVGLICNRASVLPDGRFILDALKARGIDVSVVFTPEHGLQARADAGAPVPSGMVSGVMVQSLYGARRRPDSLSLARCDVLLYDLQDVGLRFYTYIATLGLCMQAAAARGIPFIVLDRPAPLNGRDVEGPLLDSSEFSFVGPYPLPLRYAMTPGELARMIHGESWLDGLDSLHLVVVPMKNWHRHLWFDQTGIPWIPPSPNLPSLETALVYAATCLVEGTSLSEGRGTEAPFRWIGAPWLEGKTEDLAVRLSNEVVRVDTGFFVPDTRPGASSPKFLGERCAGLRISVVDRNRFRACEFAILLLAHLRVASGSHWSVTPSLRRLTGEANMDRTLSSPQLWKPWLDKARQDSDSFLRTRRPYLLY